MSSESIVPVSRAVYLAVTKDGCYMKSSCFSHRLPLHIPGGIIMLHFHLLSRDVADV